MSLSLKEIAKDPEYGKYDFISKWPLFAGVSIFLMIASIGLMMFKGFNYGIDFKGGTEIQVKFEQAVQPEEMRKFVNDLGLSNASVQALDAGDVEYLIRTDSEGKTDDEMNKNALETNNKLSAGLMSTFEAKKPEVRRVDTVGPQVGEDLKRNSILAAFYSMVAILLYISLRFDYKFAPGAVFCLVHDAIITLGIYSLLDKEVNLQTLASVLTIIGYSLNDTIINFDRIRENLPVYKKKPLAMIINRSVNDMLSRTIITSLVVIAATIVLYIFADGVIEEMAFALTVGFVASVYSTMYVSSPLVLLFDKPEA